MKLTETIPADQARDLARHFKMKVDQLDEQAKFMSNEETRALYRSKELVVNREGIFLHGEPIRHVLGVAAGFWYMDGAR